MYVYILVRAVRIFMQFILIWREGGNLIFITDALDLSFFSRFSCWRFFPFVMSGILFVSLSAQCILHTVYCSMCYIWCCWFVFIKKPSPLPPLPLLLLLLFFLSSSIHMVRIRTISYAVLYPYVIHLFSGSEGVYVRTFSFRTE